MLLGAMASCGNAPKNNENNEAIDLDSSAVTVSDETFERRLGVFRNNLRNVPANPGAQYGCSGTEKGNLTGRKIIFRKLFEIDQITSGQNFTTGLIR